MKKFNASMLKRWVECPLQVKLGDELSLPYEQNSAAVFGSCVHEALELYNITFDVTGAIERFLFTWDNPEDIGLHIDYYPGKTTWKQYREMGKSIIQSYHDKTRLQDRTVISTEHKFCVPLGEDFLLSGVVDLLELGYSSHGAPQLRVMDFKTNTRKPTKLELTFDLQFTVYYYASMQPEFWLGMPEIDPKYAPMQDGEEWMNIFADDDVERKAIWWHLRTMKEIDCGPRDAGDFVRMHRLVDSVANAMDAGIYIPSIKSDACNWCPYTQNCTAVGPIKHRIDESRFTNKPVIFKSTNPPPKQEYKGSKWM